jgi:hypothetical protein
MNEPFSIAPPPELIEQWMQAHFTKYDLARHAAQWGANQELEACCAWLREFHPGGTEQLRCSRRPKPPRLKEQALLALSKLPPNRDCGAAHETIRHALEALPND